MTNEPTAAERQMASKILDAFWDAIKNLEGASPRDVIAQALADQRAKYEAVAEEIEAHAESRRGSVREFLSHEMPMAANTEAGRVDAYTHAVQLVRQVSK